MTTLSFNEAGKARVVLAIFWQFRHLGLYQLNQPLPMSLLNDRATFRRRLEPFFNLYSWDRKNQRSIVALT